MAKLDCKPDKYPSQDGKRCCDRCPAGKYVRSDCDGTAETKCETCGRGSFTATTNNLYQCILCRVCHNSNQQKKVKECLANEDTQCGCNVPGYYCNEPDCEHCKLVTHCPVGEGVKAKATRMIDTICAPCETGTFSNVSDFYSSCQPHKRCEDWGGVLETPGTPSADAVCGRFKTQCPWILAASLWSGLALTSLILLLIIYWMTKRRSYRTAGSSHPEVTVMSLPAAYVCPVDFPLPALEYTLGHCQESCEEKAVSPLFDPDDEVVIYRTQDSVESSLTIAPLTASVQFTESNHINGNGGNCARILRTHSEPQEDEWCGT